MGERDALDADVRARIGESTSGDDLPTGPVAHARRAAVGEIRRRVLTADPPGSCAEDQA